MKLCKKCQKKEATKYSKYTSGDFCSRECARSYSTLNDVKENKKLFCKNCGIEIEVGKRSSIVCCKKCRKNNFEKYQFKYRNKIEDFVLDEQFNEYKIKKSIPKEPKSYEITCMVCQNIFISKRKDKKSCSKECETNLRKFAGRKGGTISVQKQNRRSKNEIYFAELCKESFKNVLLNEQMFNGWDADIILPDYKIAILWNGNWHHKKISEQHSLLQVQNRDNIKIKEIINCEYIPYIVEDYGKYNKKFVELEFNKLKNKITGEFIVISSKETKTLYEKVRARKRTNSANILW